MKFIGDDDDDGRKRNYFIMLWSITTVLYRVCNGQQQPIVSAKSKAFI
jgi:hypothetical protein